MKTKKYILKIIIIPLVFGVFFVFAIPESVASAPVPATIFELPESATVGHIDTSVENKIKVCKDVACANETPGTIDFPTPGFIDFDVSGTPPLSIDSEKGISGKVWGDELGWVTFNPPYGGVFFADPTTGFLKGTAWSETSGAINFSATGQQVVIDPKTGAWNGWAWASGPYGGWIKFDCKNNTSCVHSTWRGETKPKSSTRSSTRQDLVAELDKNTGPSFLYTTFVKTKIIASNILNNFSASLINLYHGTATVIGDVFDFIRQAVGNTYNFLFSFFAHLFDGTKEIIGATGKTLGAGGQAIGQAFNIFVAGSENLLGKGSQTIYLAGKMVGQGIGIAGKTAGQAIGDAFGFVGQTIGNASSTVGQGIGIAGKTAGQVVRDAGNAVGQTIYLASNAVGQAIGHTGNAVGKATGAVSASFANLYHGTSQLVGNAYQSLSFSFANLRASVLEGVHNLLK